MVVKGVNHPGEAAPEWGCARKLCPLPSLARPEAKSGSGFSAPGASEAELFPGPGQAAPGAGTALGSKGGRRGGARGAGEDFYVTASRSPPRPAKPESGTWCDCEHLILWVTQCVLVCVTACVAWKCEIGGRERPSGSCCFPNPSGGP